MSGTPTSLIFLDCETTGLRPDRHTIWEIAWVTALHLPTGQLVQRARRVFQIRLAADELAVADPAALKVGRYYERSDDSLATSKWDAIARLQQDTANIQRDGGGKVPHLVGAVPTFDHNMLCSNWLGWPGYGEGLWHYHLIDVEALAAGRLMAAPPWDSKALTGSFGVGVDPSREHTAAGDVEWAIATYAAVYELEVV